MSYNRVKNSKRITQVLLCCLGLWNLALAISTSCLSRVLLCPGSCTFVIPIYKCLYFCHSFIQAPVLLSVFLSPAKTFCSACMTLSGVKKQGRSSSSFHKHLSILTNKATCNSYKQVPVLLSILYTSTCTFVNLLIINGENILCSAFWRYQASKGNSSFLNYKISTSTSTASSRVLLFPGSCTFLINGENFLSYACMTLSGVKKQGHSSSAYLYWLLEVTARDFDTEILDLSFSQSWHVLKLQLGSRAQLCICICNCICICIFHCTCL